MQLHTTYVKALANKVLVLRFNNGAYGEVSLADELYGDMFAPLCDDALFMTAQQNEVMGTVVWANGADLAPEFLLSKLKAQTECTH
jgi:hypothetical protein